MPNSIATPFQRHVKPPEFAETVSPMFSGGWKGSGSTKVRITTRRPAKRADENQCSQRQRETIGIFQVLFR